VKGKWLDLIRRYSSELSDKQILAAEARAYEIRAQKKKRFPTGRRSYRPDYLILQDGGEVHRSKNRFWSGDMFISLDQGEAREMDVREIDGKEFLLLERDDFDNLAENDSNHTGYRIYIREEHADKSE
jgi:hypothetical protein